MVSPEAMPLFCGAKWVRHTEGKKPGPQLDRERTLLFPILCIWSIVFEEKL